MDRYKNYVKIEEIRELLRQGKNEEALELTDGMDPEKIKSNFDCSVLAQVYLHNGMLSKAKECFCVMHGRQKSRRVVMELVNLSIRLKQPEEAEEYYSEYKELAPNDYYNYIFRYKIDRLKNRPLEELAASLEALKEAEFFDNWGYELAKVYHKMGNEEKCVKTCDEVILWFGDGESVERAKVLKAYYQGELSLKEMSEKTANDGFAGRKDDREKQVEVSTAAKQAKEANGAKLTDTRPGIAPAGAAGNVQDTEKTENLGDTRLAPGGWITKEALEALENAQKADSDREFDGDMTAAADFSSGRDEREGIADDTAADGQTSGKTAKSKKKTRAQKKAEKKQQRREESEESAFMEAIGRELGFIDEQVQKASEEPRSYDAGKASTASEEKPEPEAKEIPNTAGERKEGRRRQDIEAEIEEEKLASLVGEIFAEETNERAAEQQAGSIRVLKPAKPVAPPEESRTAEFISRKGKTLEDYFGFFGCRKDMATQIINALDSMLNPSVESVCYCIIGERGTGKKALVNGFAEVMKEAGVLGNVQIVWTEAAKINEISLKDRAVKLIGRCMVIDRAGALMDEAADDLIAAGRSFRNRTAIVLTDYRKNITELLNRKKELSKMFDIKLTIPTFSAGDLLQLAEYKLAKAEFRIDSKAYERLVMKIKGISRATGEGALARTEKYIMKLIDNAEQRNAADYIRQTMEGTEHVQNDIILAEDLPEEI